MLNRIIALLAVALAGLPAFAAQETLELKNLIDLSGFNFTVTGVRTADDQLQLGDESISINNEYYQKYHHFVIFSLKGQVDRPGAFILSPHAFVAEFVDSANTWSIEPASAVGFKTVAAGGKEQTFWAHGSGVRLSFPADEKGSEWNFEVAFLLPRNITTIKLGTARFVSESVAIPSP
jgi:hypothetical protein